ncbi:hypothetical protein ASC96_30570 [Rhizobium sp. Root1204]|nr:hypothetical protein ASC96_30570 [Rhizobium sp. Root1204]
MNHDQSLHARAFFNSLLEDGGFMNQGTPRGLIFVYTGMIIAIGLLIIGGALTWNKLDGRTQSGSKPVINSQDQQ